MAGRRLVQIASYNSNLQGERGLPQDLVDWLNPTLTVSQFLGPKNQQTPDIVAVGFQELLPLHFGLAGLSRAVIKSRDELIRSQIELHTAGREKYSLVAKIVNVGVALLVYARDSELAKKIPPESVQTSWTGCGPAYMGNKGAVGIRFDVVERDVRETFTFINAHLTAHAPKLQQRLADWRHIVRTLLFSGPSSVYDTSHLFLLGDLNFRVTPPRSLGIDVHASNHAEDSRRALVAYDQLTAELAKGPDNTFVGLREPQEFWRIQCTYKFQVGKVDTYSTKRTPSWTDRVLYATHADTPNGLYNESAITPLLFTSIPSYVASDHKPIVALLLLPPTPASASTAPRLNLPSTYEPPPLRPIRATLQRYGGRAVDRLVGLIWCVLWFVGAGNAAVGIFNFVLGTAGAFWWRKRGVELLPSP